MAGPGCGTDVTRAIPARSLLRSAKNLRENQAAWIVMVRPPLLLGTVFVATVYRSKR